MGGSRTDYKLFVEGSDDRHVIVSVIRALRPELKSVWDRGFDIDASNDSKALSRFHTALLGATGAYGLVLDADVDPRKNLAARWRSVQQILQKAGVTAPEVPPRDGWLGQVGPSTARSGLGPRIGVWLMPNNEDDGALEAFIEPLVPAADASWAYAGQVTGEARRAHAAPFPDKYVRKARLHTWLAWREEPGRPYGRAIDCGDLQPHANPVAQRFVAWFSALFGPSQTAS